MEAFENVTKHLKNFLRMNEGEFKQYNDVRLGKAQDSSLSALLKSSISVARPTDVTSLPDSEIPF